MRKALSTKIGKADYFIIASLTLYALSNAYPPLETLALWGMLPACGLLVFHKLRTPAPTVYLKLLLALYVWCAFTAIFGIDGYRSLASLKTMAGTYMFCYILHYMSLRYKTFYCVGLIYILFLAGCCYYAQTHILAFHHDVGQTERLDGEGLNANIFGYYTFIVTFIVYLFGDITRTPWLRRMWRLLYILLIPFSFYVAYLTASRQVLLMQVPYFSFSLLYRYLLRAGAAAKLLFIGACLAFCLKGIPYIIDAFEDSLLMKRSEVEVGEDSRADLARQAIQVGMDNLALGVGPNNFMITPGVGGFAHNTYLELFADSGLVGMLLFVWLLGLFIVRVGRQWVRRRNPIDFALLLFALFYVLDNVFYVFHTSPWLMGIFLFATSFYQHKRTHPQAYEDMLHL